MNEPRGRGMGAARSPAAGRAAAGGHDRITMLLAAVAVAAAGLILLLLFATVQSLYKGTRSGYLGPMERPAVARVNDCRRLGPVSVDGFGFWWKCQVTVQVTDGRVVGTVVDRSIVTPADTGRGVELREACKHRTTDCTYGRPTGRLVKAAFGALVLIEWCVLCLCAFVVVLLLARAVLGREGYSALYDRLGQIRASAR